MRTPPPARRSTLPILALSLAALADTARAQLTGDIAVSGFSATNFGVLRGASLTNYATPGFQGTGNSLAVLWDPRQPNDLLLGGFGFVGRATITGPGAATYTRITANVGIVVQMSLDDRGGVILVDAGTGGTGQVRRLDPVTSVIVDLSTGPQPWGIDANAGAIHPASGDVVVGGNGALYLLPRGATQATTIATGLGGYVSGVTFDRVTGDVVATVLTANRLLRVVGATVTDVAPPGSLPGPNAIDVDQNGDFVVGGGVGQIHRVPRAGGAPVPIASYSGPLNDLAVLKPDGFGMPFGTACNGAAGPAQLTATGPYQVGSTLTLTSTGHAPGTLGVTILGLDNVTHQGLPLPFLLDPLLGTNGCSLHVAIDATAVGFTSAASPANLVFSLPLTPPFAGQRVFFQQACFEPVPGSMSWSNGLLLRMP